MSDQGVAPPPRGRTARRMAGDGAEAAVANLLAARGWHVVGRNVRVGRDELDIVALEPSMPATLVVVEVRSRTDQRFGAPEESVDAGKVGRLYRAAAAIARGGLLPDGSPAPEAWRVDLVTMVREAADRPWGLGTYLRGLAPP